MIHFSKCKIQYPHDFEDYPCRKCNAFLMIADGNVMIKGRTVNTRTMFYSFILAVMFFITS